MVSSYDVGEQSLSLFTGYHDTFIQEGATCNPAVVEADVAQAIKGAKNGQFRIILRG